MPGSAESRFLGRRGPDWVVLSFFFPSAFWERLSRLTKIFGKALNYQLAEQIEAGIFWGIK